MQYVYTATNKIDGGVYVGKTNNLKKRQASHKCQAKGTNTKCRFHNAIRHHGWDAFEWRIALYVPVDESVNQHEKDLIEYYQGLGKCYNILPGGGGGHKVKPENLDIWRERMKAGRAGLKPALGMRHSAKNKALFSKLSNEWWATQQKIEIGNPWSLSFVQAKREFGISKTHFYRLRRAWEGDMPEKIPKSYMKGDSHYFAKLTEQTAQLILDSTEPNQILADRYGVGRATVAAVKSGRSWMHLVRSDGKPKPRQFRRPRSK